MEFDVYSRKNPSARYTELIKLYRHAHEQGQPEIGNKPEDTFAGKVRIQHASRISFFTKFCGARRLLDYGAGKGHQYDLNRTDVDLREVYGVTEITCYDPGHQPYSSLPDGSFDGVICLDVMEHCPEEDLPWIISEIIGYAERFAYFTVACFKAKKKLPNGENAHCTVRPPAWWKAIFKDVAARNPDVMIEVILQEQNAEQMLITEQVLDLNQ